MISIQPLTRGVTESISEMGKLEIKELGDMSKFSDLVNSEAEKSSQLASLNPEPTLCPLLQGPLVSTE